MKKKRNKLNYFSTNPDFKPLDDFNEDELEIIQPNAQNLEVCIDKHRAGKIAVIIKKYVGPSSEIKDLAKKLKKECGVGGSVKNNEIIIQGNVREKIMEILEREGYNFKRVGG